MQVIMRHTSEARDTATSAWQRFVGVEIEAYGVSDTGNVRSTNEDAVVIANAVLSTPADRAAPHSVPLLVVAESAGTPEGPWRPKSPWTRSSSRRRGGDVEARGTIVERRPTSNGRWRTSSGPVTT